MPKIQLIKGDFHYPDTDFMVFEGLDLDLDTAWKSAIVARNGKGKSTLLRLIHGDLALSRGTLTKDVDTSLFPLSIQTPNLIVMELLKAHGGPFQTCERVMEAYLRGEETEENYYNALEIYLEMDGYGFEARVQKECAGLGVNPAVLSQKFETLSGGEQTKIQILMLFLKPGTFTLLDEPTNHLDQEGIRVLGDYLSQKEGFLVVSHHREFLNRCSDHTIALEKTGVTVIKGGFEAYEEDYRLRQEFEDKQRLKAQKEVNRLETAYRQKREWAQSKESTVNGSGDKGFVSAEARRSMKRALHIENRMKNQLEEKQSLIKYQEQVPKLKITQGKSPRVLLQVSNLFAGYEGKAIISNLSFNLEVGERLAITGANGSGKSTLVKALLGEIVPISGLVNFDNRVEIAYVPQFPSYDRGMLREILQGKAMDESRFRNILGAFCCHREIFERDLSTFSLGELKKVDLAFSLYSPSHLLIWDEPLNGLDILTRQAIEEAVATFQPTLIFIEHDETFVNRAATKEIRLS
ncbi:MAG: ATP-binding cassette domain-containing protein [Turicibacter sp.]|nr:ATP-binding cassette domain-containing protein [Turicibacter sp.]